MEMYLPGVQFSDTPLSQAQPETPTAVPVFIGYSEQGVPKTLYSIVDWSDFQQQLGTPDEAPGRAIESVLYYAVQHYFDNGGGPCFVVSLDTYAAIENLTPEQLITALQSDDVKQLIASESQITLVSMPDLVLLTDQSEDYWAQGWQALLHICQSRRGLFALLDAPDDVDAARECLDSSADWGPELCAQGAAYWPRLVTVYASIDAGPDGMTRISVPPSAAMAAVIQHIDREHGVWKAPANVALAKVVKPAQPYLTGESLFDSAKTSLNMIRSFPGRGVRVWGCRTLLNASGSGDSPWRYVQNRRLVSYIELKISEMGRFVVFEPNNEITWLKLKGQVRTWLRGLWLQGGLFGQEENEAFQLHLGLNESMTPDDINAGRLIMRISMALLSPAEFIELNLQFATSESNTRQQAWTLNRGEFQ